MKQQPKKLIHILLTWVRTESLLLFALAVGTALRIYQLSSQIPGEDEIHTLKVLIENDFGWIASHFGNRNFCIPLTLYYKILAVYHHLSEWSMYLPVLFCGVGSIILIPLMVRGHLGREVSNCFALLLAVSPMHIYFSRYARPYGIAMLLAWLGIMAFYNWWSGRSRRWSWVFGLSAVLCPYFLLPFAPFMFSPLLFALGDALFSKVSGSRPPLKSLCILGGLSAAGLFLLLAIPLLNDFDILCHKLGHGNTNLNTLVNSSLLLSGTASTGLFLAWMIGAATGCALFFLEKARMVIYLCLISACQVISVLLSDAVGSRHPIILARYMLPLLSVLLLFLSFALAGLDRQIKKKSRIVPPGLTGLIFAGILFLCGPIPKTYYWPNNWTNHAVFQNYPGTVIGQEQVRAALLKISSFYRNLKKLDAGSQVIVEAPWIFGWSLNPYPFYQAVHRQYTYVGFVKDICGKGRMYFELPKDHPGLRFQNYVHVSDDALLSERDVRFIILHKDLPNEIARFLLEINIDPIYGTPSSTVTDINVIRKKILLLMSEPPNLEPLITLCQSRYGAPVFEDRDLVVFDRMKE